MEQENTTIQSAIVEENNEFLANQHQRQEQIFRQQDEHLGVLSNTITRLGGMGKEIDKAIKEQDGIIMDVGNDIDKTEGGLKGAIKRVNDLIDSTRDSTQWCIIVFLILVFLILIFLVFYL